MNDIKIFEEIRKDLASNENLKIPMSYVFGRGTIEGEKSFGNTSLQENAKKVDAAIENMSALQDIWNHSHTQWTWKHLNLSHFSPYNNMRQIAAEIANRKAALNDAKWRSVEAEIKLRKLQEKLSKEGIDYWDEVDTKIEILKIKESMAEGASYIEGAMKDILTLNSLYEQLKERVSGFTEYDIEKEELRSHLKRSISQCIRDVREIGSISKGEQEYLEQIGVNPTKMQVLLRRYVKDEEKVESWDISIMHSFVDGVVEDLVKNHKIAEIKMDIQGFKEEPIQEYTYNHKIAIK